MTKHIKQVRIDDEIREFVGKHGWLASADLSKEDPVTEMLLLMMRAATQIKVYRNSIQALEQQLKQEKECNFALLCELDPDYDGP